jgi:TPP-dependent pyruvate/acetoin dehydrogenase alpha subunit
VRQFLAGFVAEELFHALGMAFDAASRGRGSVAVVAYDGICCHS